MRQDFAAILTDKYGKEVFVYDPRQFGYDSTLTRHAQVGNIVVRAVLKRLYDQPFRVAWIGDRAGFRWENRKDSINFGDGFITSWKAFKILVGASPYAPCPCNLPVTLESSRQAFLGVGPAKRCYIANITKGEYLDMAEYVEETFPVLTEGSNEILLDPLPLLTAVGNSEDIYAMSEGDYVGGTCMEMVGSWAFDELIVTKEDPTATLLCRNFTKIHPRFQYDVFEQEVP